MKNYVVRGLIGCIVALNVCAAYAAQPADTTAEQSSNGGNGLEEIVVTASKRSERLQDAPIAISAIEQARLQQLGIASFADYASLVPNLVEANGATPGTGVVIIRGLYSGNTQTTATTATYIGETPFTPSGSVSLSTLFNADPDLLDVERVEVLKGPQGTLYGASSLGGLIRIIPAAPDPSAFSGQVRVSGAAIDGGGTGGGIHASANLPLSDSVALRVGAFERTDPGFTTNVGTGHKDLGSTQAEGGSAALKANISPQWDVQVSGLFENSKTKGFWEQNAIPGTGTTPYGERTYNYAYDGETDTQMWLTELTTNYRFDAGTITGTLSHAHYAATLAADGTQTYGVLNGLVAGALGFNPFPADTTTQVIDNPVVNKTTAELRFASKRLGAIEFLSGFFYTDENTNIPVLIPNESPAGVPVQLPGALSAFNDVVNVTSINSYKEYAAFGDATYFITDAFDLTAGLRYSHNSQTVTDISPPGGVINAGNFALDFSDHSVIYQGSARWRPSNDTSLYFRVASGYRPGGPQPSGVSGPNVPPTYKADSLVSYELGAKGRLADTYLSYEVSVYHEDWKDIQLNSFVNGFTVFGNGGAAKIDGAEAQLDWVDPSGVKVGAALGYNNARLTEINAGTAIVLGASAGDRLPGSPKVTASAYAEYQWNFTQDLKGTVGAIERYQGNKVSSFPGDMTNLNYVIPSYATLDLRTALDWQRYTADFRITNVTDKNGITGYRDQQLLPNTAPADAYLIRPRTFAISFTAHF